MFVLLTLCLLSVSCVSTTLPEAVTGEESMELINSLIAEGADLEEKNEDGKTALILAVEEGYMEAVNALISAGADVNAKTDSGRTALMQLHCNYEKMQ